MPKGRLTIATTDLLAHEVNGVGVVTLNRPEAINSLNQPMVSAMHTALTDWATDDDVHTVILTRARGRGLCAGGDVVAIYRSTRADGEKARRVWYDEYLLNARIRHYPEPFVSLTDGIVIGEASESAHTLQCASSPTPRKWPCPR